MGNVEHPAPTNYPHGKHDHHDHQDRTPAMTPKQRRGQRPIPKHWQLFFDQKGIRSALHLSQLTGIPSMTINRLVQGDSRTRPEILREVARALKVDEAVIYGLAGWPKTTRPWEPPIEAEAMNDRQRKAATEMIRAFVQPAFEQGEDAPAELPQDVFDLAADHRGSTEGQAQRNLIDMVGEEDQDAHG